MKVNVKNILRSIALMETIPEERIHMGKFRDEFEKPFTHVCQSNGCVIGFSTELDTMENLSLFTTGEEGEFFDYDSWSIDFFGVDSIACEWEFMFGDYWPDNKEQIIKRMQWIADGKELPNNFFIRADKAVDLLNFELVLP